MDYRRRIIVCINPYERVADNGFSQITFRITFSYAFVYGVRQKTARYMYFLTYLHKYDRHARILTNRNGFVFCYVRIFGKLTEYFLSYFRLFGLFGIFQGAVNVVVQYAVCLYTKLRHSFRYGVYRYFSHYKGSPSAKLSFVKKT